MDWSERSKCYLPGRKFSLPGIFHPGQMKSPTTRIGYVFLIENNRNCILAVRKRHCFLHQASTINAQHEFRESCGRHTGCLFQRVPGKLLPHCCPSCQYRLHPAWRRRSVPRSGKAAAVHRHGGPVPRCAGRPTTKTPAPISGTGQEENKSAKGVPVLPGTSLAGLGNSAARSTNSNLKLLILVKWQQSKSNQLQQ